MPEPIKIDGLDQFVRDLRKIDSGLPKAVRIALNEVADVIAGEARTRMPKRSGRAAASIRKASTRTAVRVREGGKRASYVPWLDFGGRVGPKRSIHRPFLKEGRYLYAAYFKRKASGDIHETMTRALLDVVRQAGIEVD